MIDDAVREAALEEKRTEGSPYDSAAVGAATGGTHEGPDAHLDALPDILFVLDDHGTILACRGGDPRDLTFPRHRLIGKRVTACAFDDVGSRFASAMATAGDGSEPVSIEYTLRCDGGPARFEARLVRSGHGRFLAVVRNMTRRRSPEPALPRTERESRELIRSTHAAALLLDPSTGRIIECNPHAGRMYRVDHHDLIGRSLRELFVDPTRAPDLAFLATHDRSEKVESWQRVGDAGVILVEMLLSPVTFPDQRAVLCLNREIEPASGVGPRIRNVLSMLKATLDATADGILVLDPDGKFVAANRLLGEMWNVPPELLEPGRESEAAEIALQQVEDPEPLIERIAAIRTCPRTRSKDLVRFRDGRVFECVSIPQRICGQDAGRVWSFRDITDRVRAEERIRHHAYHDSLTGLPNRALFQDRLVRELARAKRNGSNSALLLIDLDGFKTINDSLGHAAGDDLLIEVARRLRSRHRESDTVARLGGDEFVFLVSSLRQKEDAAIVAEQVLEVLRPPMRIAEHDLHVSASVGVAIYPDDGDDGTSLMKSADVALYRAKELGRDNYQIFEPKLNQRAIERMVLIRHLRQAIHDREFVLQYQPQYDLKTGRMCGVEALVRWRQDGTIMPPDQFVPIAEESGLIVPLGRWVLEEAARDCAEINRHTDDPLRICVNVSARQIQRPDFAKEVSQIVQEAGLRPRQLVVELTESALMQHPGQTSRAMEQLRQLGIGIAMDDFGTGHSSLKRVSLLPISIIKVDRSLVMSCLTRQTDQLILGATVRMGHALGMKVLAEGVETEEQARILRDHGCDEVQGYLYSRPVSRERVIRLLRTEQPTAWCGK